MSRMERVNQQLKQEISIIVQRDLRDPRVEFVTITHVDVSPDLKNAKVYYSALGDQQQSTHAEQGLMSARGMIRKLLSKKVNMRYTPELSFIYDKTISESARIEDTLKEIKDEYEKNHTGD